MNLEQIDTSTTAGKAEVMRLAAEGRKVMFRQRGDAQWLKHAAWTDPDWNWLDLEYAVIRADLAGEKG